MEPSYGTRFESGKDEFQGNTFFFFLQSQLRNRLLVFFVYAFSRFFSGNYCDGTHTWETHLIKSQLHARDILCILGQLKGKTICLLFLFFYNV